MEKGFPELRRLAEARGVNLVEVAKQCKMLPIAVDKMLDGTMRPKAEVLQAVLNAAAPVTGSNAARDYTLRVKHMGRIHEATKAPAAPDEAAEDMAAEEKDDTPKTKTRAAKPDTPEDTLKRLIVSAREAAGLSLEAFEARVRQEGYKIDERVNEGHIRRVPMHGLLHVLGQLGVSMAVRKDIFDAAEAARADKISTKRLSGVDSAMSAARLSYGHKAMQKHFGQVLHESLKSVNMSPKQFDDRARLETDDAFSAAMWCYGLADAPEKATSLLQVLKHFDVAPEKITAVEQAWQLASRPPTLADRYVGR